MRNATRRWTGMQRAIALALLAGLGACGGGGDDDGQAPSGWIDLTAANMEAVAHAAASGAFALGLSSAAEVGGGSSPTGSLHATVLAALRNGAAGQRMRAASAGVAPLEVYTMPQACMVSGTVTLSWDDRDNNDDLNAGDALGFVFSDCQNDDTEVLNGSVNVVMTRIDGGAQLTGFAGRMTLTALSGRALDGRHAYTVNGALRMEFTQTSATSETLRLTTDGDVVANVQTHRFTDTVTLLAGYVNDSSYDSTQMRGSNAFNGSFRSTAAGGMMRAATTAPFIDLATDDHPSSGTLRITSNKGTIDVQALSTSQVRIALDADGDGAVDASQTETWDWLL